MKLRLRCHRDVFPPAGKVNTRFWRALAMASGLAQERAVVLNDSWPSASATTRAVTPASTESVECGSGRTPARGSAVQPATVSHGTRGHDAAEAHEPVLEQERDRRSRTRGPGLATVAGHIPRAPRRSEEDKDGINRARDRKAVSGHETAA